MKIADTVRSFQEIVDGKHDDIPEQAFYMKGDIDEVLEAAEKMKAAPRSFAGSAITPSLGAERMDRTCLTRSNSKSSRRKSWWCDDHAEQVQIPGKSGYLGILPGHAPLITELDGRRNQLPPGGATHSFAVAWGFAEVLPDKVTILADTAERAEEIDVKRAQEAKPRAEQRLSSISPETDYPRAVDAMQRAETRLHVAEKK